MKKFNLTSLSLAISIIFISTISFSFSRANILPEKTQIEVLTKATIKDSELEDRQLLDFFSSYHQTSSSCFEECGFGFVVRCDYGGEGCTPEMQWFCDELCPEQD